METQRAQWKKLHRTYDRVSGVETGVTPNKRLTKERLQKLEAVGFAWTAKPARKISVNTAASSLTVSNDAIPSKPSPPMAVPNAKPATDLSVGDKFNHIQPQQQQQARRNRLNDAQWEGKVLLSVFSQ